MQETWVGSLGLEDPPGEDMATPHHLLKRAPEAMEERRDTLGRTLKTLSFTSLLL